jgi:hypothetical protein
MAANKSAYLRSRLVKHALGDTSFTMPTNTYLALYTADPTVDDTGTEVTGGSYARKLLSWGTEDNGILPTDAVADFTDLPTATITHWGIRDASSAGNLLYFGRFEFPLAVTAGQDLAFAAGDIYIAEA